MEALGYTLILILTLYIAYNIHRIKIILRERSEERTDNRRAFYRARAYKDLAYKRGLKNNREMLFKAISKEGIR